MIDLDLWFPEDFDKRYTKYREGHAENKIPDPFLAERLEKAKESLFSISDEEEYQHEIDKWKPLKQITDAIYKELSPFVEKSQSVKIDLAKLGMSENQTSPILLMLVYERVCRWKINESSAVISTAPIHEYLSGDGIVVPDYEKFQELRKEINNFYKFIEHQKDQKFPKDSSVAKSRALVKKLEEVSKDDEEKIDTTVKRVATWGGEVVSDVPLIDYNETTGKGEVVGKKKFKFKDGSSEYNVFKMLYAKLGKKPAKLERLDVLVAGGFYPDHQQELDPVRKTAETACINEIAKNIREKTGLNTEELVNNNGSLTLLALRQDKNPPKITKFVPVWG